jgi:hypothetical protein
MKNNPTYIIIIIILLVISLTLKFDRCNEPELVNNTHELQQIDSLRQEYALLKKQSTLQEVELEKAKKRKDSVVYVTKNHYIMAYDTITKDSVECLPKPYVDSLCDAFEYVLDQSDSLLLTKNSEITNLEKIVKKDSVVISNYQQNEQVLIKSVKKERRNKWLFGIGGFISGVIVGKL